MVAHAQTLNEFLDPKETTSPLIELPNTLNPIFEDKVRIFAKAVFLSPLLNVKYFPAFSLLQAAKERGELDGVHTIVENSSGNMAFSLAILAPIFGIKRVVAIVPRDIPSGKFNLLRLSGVDIEFNNESPGGTSGVVRARELGRQDGWHNLGQYENDYNPKAYEQYLAPEIWEQTNGMINVFCTGLGSTGTAIGTARFLKKQNTSVTVIGVTPRQDSIPGVRSVRRLEEVVLKWRDTIDFLLEVETKESFKKSLDLCRAGVLAGPSSGLALIGLLTFLKERKRTDTLDQLRNRDGEVIAVFVCPDTALLYLEKYSTHLDPEDFRTDVA